jgi:hypothetical protein
MSDGETPDDGERDVEDILPPEEEVSPGADGAEPADEDPDVDAPLDGMADAARKRPDDDDLMDAFDEVDVDGVDDEALWEQLEDDPIESTVDDPRGASERDVQVVSKRDYCMHCQYFSAPPEVRCGHDRGEILEVVDSEQFEVADCPILRGEEELENLRR